MKYIAVALIDYLEYIIHVSLSLNCFYLFLSMKKPISTQNNILTQILMFFLGFYTSRVLCEIVRPFMKELGQSD